MGGSPQMTGTMMASMRGSGKEAVGGDDEGGVPLHQLFVQQDPAQRDAERDNDQQVTLEGCLSGAAVTAAHGDERGPGG